MVESSLPLMGTLALLSIRPFQELLAQVVNDASQFDAFSFTRALLGNSRVDSLRGHKPSKLETLGIPLQLLGLS